MRPPHLRNSHRISLGYALCRAFNLSIFVLGCASLLAFTVIPHARALSRVTICPPGVRCKLKPLDTTSLSSSSSSNSESLSLPDSAWFNVPMDVRVRKPVILSKNSAPGADEPRADPYFVAAAASGNILLMKELIASGAPVDGRTGTRSTALHSSSSNGRDDAVELLLVSGALVDSRDIYGGTPLIAAATEGREGVIQLLLKAGASLTSKRVNDYATALLRASRGGHLKAVEKLIEASEGKGNIDKVVFFDAVDKQGRTSLMYAAQLGAQEIATALITGGANVGVVAPDGVTALQWAQQRKHQTIVDALVAGGAVF
jgi:ankyrin repeat protein